MKMKLLKPYICLIVGQPQNFKIIIIKIEIYYIWHFMINVKYIYILIAF